VVDGDDVTGLLVRMGGEQNMGRWADEWMDTMRTESILFID
jgi:hypothetical protein